MKGVRERHASLLTITQEIDFFSKTHEIFKKSLLLNSDAQPFLLEKKFIYLSWVMDTFLKNIFSHFPMFDLDEWVEDWIGDFMRIS